MASGFKQAGRLISFSSPAGQDVLLASSINGVEGVSRLYSFDVELLSTQDTLIDPTVLVGNKATLSLALLGVKGFRYFNGFVSSFQQHPSYDTFHRYTARLVPSLWQLTLATNCRVFQDQNVMDIIKAVIAPYSLTVSDQTVAANFKPLEYCTQYNETDFNFISRLAEQFGIFYWFEHTADNNIVHFGNAMSAYGNVPLLNTYSFAKKTNASDALQLNRVRDLRTAATWVTGKHTTRSWDFRTKATVDPATQTSGQPYGKNALEDYSWPGHDSGFSKKNDTNVLTAGHSSKTMIVAQRDANDVHAQSFHGESDARTLTPGYTFTLTEHPVSSFNRLYYLYEVAHAAVQSPAYGDEAVANDPYSNSFTAIQGDRLCTPLNHTPKPKMMGPQNAIVVAPSGEDNYIDKYGRANVRFLWDRTFDGNGTDNTWVRVAQPWAGPKTGAYFWPRLGDEVLIQFVDGDPDDPILMGSVYNGQALPKYALPDMSTRSGFYTRSLKGGGADNANELRFEDKAGSEQIFINAEKDLDLMVENDRRTHVKGQDSLIVDKDQLESIGGSYNRKIGGDYIEAITGKQDVAITGIVSHKYSAAHNLDVGGDSVSHVAGDQGSKIDGDVSQKIGGKLSLNITGDHAEKNANLAVESDQSVYIKGGMTVVIEAGMQLSLKVGGNFIDISPMGVAISGTMVLINSGGAAGSGSPPSPTAPKDPGAPTAPKDPDKADDGTKGGKM